METIILPRTGQAPLRIAGDKIASADGAARRPRAEPLARDRHLRPRRRLRGSDSLPHEMAGRVFYHDLAEVVQQGGDVARVLAEYDPLAHLGGFPSGPAYAERQAKLEAEVRAVYEALVSEVLADDRFAVDVSAAVYGQDVRGDGRTRRRLELDSLHLTRPEASAVCDATNGTVLDKSSWQSLWAEVADADRLNDLGAKWEIDAKALSARIHAASPGAATGLGGGRRGVLAGAPPPADRGGIAGRGPDPIWSAAIHRRFCPVENETRTRRNPG